ncbi:MAG: carboxypeptidase regulatory-like domain-containing protein [Candidatus Cloacimonetes bacterium]|nr:carboxypeptidase regulatory-like domain-containing protein [Candidatus Cloacimonadota bacterium]
MKWLILFGLVIFYTCSFAAFVPVDNRDGNDNSVTGDYPLTHSYATLSYEFPSRFAESSAIGFCNTYLAWHFDFGYLNYEAGSPESATNSPIAPYITVVNSLCFDGNYIWGVEWDGYRLFSIDYETGEHKVFGMTEPFTVLDYCQRDRELYGITLGGGIYAIDQETGDSNFLVQTISDIAGGCMGNDNYFYCMERTQGEFVRIDPLTGEWESLALFNESWTFPIGFTCDRYTGLIYYMNRISNLIQLCSFDPENNMHEIVGAFPDYVNCSALCIPSWQVESGVALPVTNLTPVNYPDVELSWCNPLETVNGDPLTEIEEIQIYRDDNLIGIITDTDPGAGCVFTDTNPHTCMNYYTIIVMNEVGAGVAKEKAVWFGPDMPGKVKNVIIDKEDDCVQVHWLPPEEGRFLGNWSGNVSSYHILCNDGTEAMLDGNEQNWTHYPSYEGFLKYDIYAENETGQGLPESSVWIEYNEENSVYLGSYDTPFLMLNHPFNTYPYDGLSECIYPAEYLTGSGFSQGEITAISYEITNTPIQEVPYEIYAGETERISLAEGWVMADELELVYEGLLDFEEGYQNLLIEFNQPYQYMGANLIIMIHRLWSDGYFTCHTKATDLFTYPECARNFCQIDQWAAPLNLSSPPGVPAISLLPNVKFFWSEIISDNLSGIITDNENQEVLPGVMIILDNAGNTLETSSGYNGSYYFPNLPANAYGLRTEMPGYRIFEDTVEIEGERENFNISLVPAGLINITGHLLTNEGAVVSGAEINLEGLICQNTISDDNGNFILSDIWDSNDYRLQVSHFGQNTREISLRADSISMNLGDIVLSENLYPIYEVSAVLIDEQQVDVSWSAVDTTVSLWEDFELDNGGFSTNEGWGWGIDSLIAENGSEKLWGTGLNNYFGYNVNHSLFSPPIQIDQPDYQLTFDHIYRAAWGAAGNMKISADNGQSWEVLYPQSGYDEVVDNEYLPLYNEPGYTTIHYSWNEETCDLSEFYGETVLIRWQFCSSPSIWEDYGWYIDNCKVSYDNSREMESYRIIKGVEPLINNYQDWEVIATGINELSYSDNTWVNTTFGGIYLYGVQVEYTGGVFSEPAFSLPLTFGNTQYYHIALQSENGEIQESQVILTSTNGFYHYEENSNATLFSFAGVWDGEYLLQVHSFGFCEYQETIQITEEQVNYVNLEYYLYPPLNPLVDEESGIMQWSAPVEEIAASRSARTQREEVSDYKVYIDDEFLAETGELFLDLTNYNIFRNGISYTAGVSAIYDNGVESDKSETGFTCHFITGDTGDEIPAETSLQSIYPNPFNPETRICFQLAETAPVKISIYNLKGEKVIDLVNRNYNAGYYNYTWNARDMGSGIYFISVTIGDYNRTQKVLLLK